MWRCLARGRALRAGIVPHRPRAPLSRPGVRRCSAKAEKGAEAPAAEAAVEGEKASSPWGMAVVGGTMLLAGPIGYGLYSYGTDVEFAQAVDAWSPQLARIAAAVVPAPEEERDPVDVSRVPLSPETRHELGNMFLLADQRRADGVTVDAVLRLSESLGFDVSDLDGQLAGCLGPEADTEGEEGGGRGEGNASGLTVQRRFSGPAADAVSADATSAKAKQALGEAYDDDEDDEEEEEEDGKKEEEEAAKEIVRRRWRPDDNVSIDEFLTHLASMARWAGTSEDTLVQRAQVVLEDARASDEALAAATGPTPAEKTEIEMYPDLRSGTPRAVADKLPRSPVDRALTAGRIDAETVRAATSLESDGGAAVAAVGDEQMRAALAGEVTDTMEDEEDDEETRRQLLDQELAMLRRQEDEVVERLRRSGREPPSWPWSLLGDGLAPGERAQLADLKERKGELKREIAQMGR